MGRVRREPNWFVLQAILLVLPLVFLAGLGALLIRRDKASVEADAREKVEAAAATLLERIAHLETNFSAADYFRLDQPWPEGTLFIRVSTRLELIFPPPAVPADPLRLSASELTLWSRAERAEFITINLPAALRIWNNLIASEESKRIREAARFERAVVLERLGRTNEALSQFAALASAPPALCLNSGVPIANLAAGKMIRAGNRLGGASGETLVRAGFSNLLSRPSRFSEALILDASTAFADIENRTKKCFAQQDAARSLYAAWLPGATNRIATVVPIRAGPAVWFTARRDTNIFARSRENLDTAVSELSRQLRFPEYTRISVFEGNELLFTSDLLFANEPSSLLRRSWTRVEIPGTNLRCEISLRDPAALYALQRQRAAVFGGVLVLATLCACFGIFYAQRNYKKQARLNELKSNFVSSVTHELRAPLASMRLISEGLQSGRAAAPGKAAEYHDFLVQECRRLSALVENVLDFSRIEQNRRTYQFEQTDLGEVCRAALQTIAPVAAERKISFKTNLSEASSLVAQADGPALQRALVNLLDNAVKHSPENGIVALTLVCTADFAEITITDHGPGIPAAEHTCIFERFYRVGSELRRETPGVGIGLSIVKHVVEAHRGSVLVRSEPGHGAAFTISIPKGEAHE